MIKKIPYGKHYIDKEDIEAVAEVLSSSNLTQGPLVQDYEAKFAKYVGAKYAVSVSSCSAGLHIGALALNLDSSKTFLTSPITFVSTAAAGLHCNSRMDLIDINPNTINLDINLLENYLKNKKVDLVIPVHFSGLPCEMHEIYNLKKKYHFNILEDAAHALGSKYECGSRVGSGKYSDLCVFSTHPVKSIATGEGGMITTNNFELYKKLLRLRSHGINKEFDEYSNKSAAYTDGNRNLWYYEMEHLGFNYRLTDIQAALGISQLKKLDLFMSRRAEIVTIYEKQLSDISNCNIAQKNTKNSSNHLFVIKIDLNKIKMKKNDIMIKYREKNIITQVHYYSFTSSPLF